MNKEFSAGGIVFNKEGLVLLTQNSKGYWQFPKGHLDKDETTKQAALREVKEEGGVEAEIIKKIGVSKYIFSFEKEKIFKIVTLFMMKYISGDPKDHDFEVTEAKWVDPEAALNMLTFKTDKSLLEKAIELMEVLS